MARFIPNKDPETGRFLAVVSPPASDLPAPAVVRSRRQPERSNPDNPSNPVVFGEDIEDLAWEALGVGLVAAANDQLVLPFVKNVVPIHNDLGGKLLDAGTTGATAIVSGGIIGFVDGPVGRKIRRGGMLLAVGRAITAVIPGFSLSAQFPIHFPALGAPAVPTPGTAGVGAAAGAAAGATAGAQAGAAAALGAGPDPTRYPAYSQYGRGLATNLNAGL